MWMSEQNERADKIRELRDLMTQLEEQRNRLGEYMDEARSHATALGEVWKNPVVGDVQAMVAGVLRQTQGFSERIAGIARRLRQTADEAEAANEQERRERQGQE